MKQKVFRFYTKHDNEKPKQERACVVGVFEDGVLKMTASRCSGRDHFSRIKGRSIAEGRLRAERIIEEVPYDGEVSEVLFFTKHAKLVEKNVIEDMSIIENLYHNKAIDVKGM